MLLLCLSHLLSIHGTSNVQRAASEVYARPSRVASMGRIGGADCGRQATISIVPLRVLQVVGPKRFRRTQQHFVKPRNRSKTMPGSVVAGTTGWGGVSVLARCQATSRQSSQEGTSEQRLQPTAKNGVLSPLRRPSFVACSTDSKKQNRNRTVKIQNRNGGGRREEPTFEAVEPPSSQHQSTNAT